MFFSDMSSNQNNFWVLFGWANRKLDIGRREESGDIVST